MSEDAVDAPETAEANTESHTEEGLQAGAADVRTGVASVDGVLAEIADLDGRPVDQHVAVFERAHETLRRALDPDSASPDA